MITPLALVEEARTWKGIPFRHQGRSRLGVDCAGFIVEVLRATSALPRHYDEPRAYGRAPSGELREVLLRYCTPAKGASIGTLVLIRWPKAKAASHVALCAGDTLIHCHSKARGVVEHGYRGPWLRDTESVWRLPNVAYE